MKISEIFFEYFAKFKKISLKTKLLIFLSVVLAVLITVCIVFAVSDKKSNNPVSSESENSSSKKVEESIFYGFNTEEGYIPETPDETNDSSSGDTIPGQTYVQTKFDVPQYTDGSVVLRETADGGQEYLDNIIFLGDSRTYGLKYYGVLKNGFNTKQVWTPANGTITLSYVNVVKIIYPETGQEITVKEAARLRQPEYLVVSLGINGIAFMDENAFDYAFSTLISDIREVSPGTHIILESMMPVSTFYQHIGSINNEKIIKGNKWMFDIAKKNKVKFLDVYNVLADEYGNLDKNLQNGDGLHPNKAGYTKLIGYIRTHALPLQSSVPPETTAETTYKQTAKPKEPQKKPETTKAEPSTAAPETTKAAPETTALPVETTTVTTVETTTEQPVETTTDVTSETSSAETSE